MKGKIIFAILFTAASLRAQVQIGTGVQIGGSSSGGVSSVGATAPVASSGGTTPVISMHVSDSTDDGYLSSTDWLSFSNKQVGLSLLKGIYTDGGWCTYAATGTLLNCSASTPQPALSLLKGTYVDGDLCGYTAAGTLLNCNIAPSGGGTVTSFSATATVAPFFTTSVANATTTPALSITVSTQAANCLFAGPTTGSAAIPTCRGLVAADIPAGVVALPSMATQAADTVVMNASGSIASPTAVAMPTCTAGALLYNTTTHALSCVLGSVTNDAQTKAAVVPNTAPSAGQILAGNAGGTAYAPVSMSGDCTLASTGAITCTKTNGTSFSALATTTPGTGIATALGVNVGTAGAPVINGGALGTPSSGTGTNITGIPVANVLSGALANGMTATTQAAAANDTKVATDAYVDGHFIASGTFTLGTAAIASGACATVVTVSATGVATTDVISVGFNSDPTGVTGYGASATGAVLSIYPYPTANNVNVKVCNSTSASITPSAMTLNWKVTR